jgi:hypothetical protein
MSDGVVRSGGGIARVTNPDFKNKHFMVALHALSIANFNGLLFALILRCRFCF